VPTIWGTMQTADNYLNNGHLPPKRPRIDGQSARVPQCRPPHTNNTSVNSMSQWSHLTPGHCGVLWSSWRRPQTRLLMLAISRFICVWGVAVRHLLSILRNRWVALTALVSRQSWGCVMCICVFSTCFEDIFESL